MGEGVIFKMCRSIWGKGLLSKRTALYGGRGYFQNVGVYMGEGVTFIMYRSKWGSIYFQSIQVNMGEALLS